MNTFVVHADSKTSKALITIFKAFNVSFEVQKENKKTLENESPYDPEFVKMVKNGSDEKEGIRLTDDYKKELFHDL